MFVISFCENNNQFDLHRKSGNKFETHNITKNSSNEVTSMMNAEPVAKVIIYGYHSSVNDEVRKLQNMYYGDYFCVSEIADDLWDHLMGEHGKSDVLLKNGLIIGEKNQIEAVAKAKGTLAGGLARLQTGTRPLSINDNFNLPQKAIVTHGSII